MFEQTNEYDEADAGSFSSYDSEERVQNPSFSRIVTTDNSMKSIFRTMEKVAETTSTVLILGQSGTGKELIARAIHDVSGSKGHFVPVNCGAIPDNLLESELFGHEKGAFTGAISSKMGRFLLADKGTIFLDEIGEMSPQLQVKLLRVLQERVVEPVGGLRGKSVDVRVIAATNVDLQEKVRDGSFREDLFYRLQVVPVEVPSLRERPGDISLLLNFFSEQFGKENGRRPLVFSNEAQTILDAYSWPGNVRELENLVQRLSILVDSDAVYASDLPAHLFNNAIPGSGFVSAELPEDGLNFNEVVQDFENSLIIQALKRTSGNKKAAAALLQLNRTTLVEKIKKKGLDESFGKNQSNAVSH